MQLEGYAACGLSSWRAMQLVSYTADGLRSYEYEISANDDRAGQPYSDQAQGHAQGQGLLEYELRIQ